MLKINDKAIAITGSASVPEELLEDKDYLVSALTSCYGKRTSSNNDGSINIKYMLKMTGEIEIKDRGGSVLKCKVKGTTPSQRLRMFLYDKWQSEGCDNDFEIFYSKQIDQIINEIKNEL